MSTFAPSPFFYAQVSRRPIRADFDFHSWEDECPARSPLFYAQESWRPIRVDFETLTHWEDEHSAHSPLFYAQESRRPIRAILFSRGVRKITTASAARLSSLGVGVRNITTASSAAQRIPASDSGRLCSLGVGGCQKHYHCSKAKRGVRFGTNCFLGVSETAPP